MFFINDFIEKSQRAFILMRLCSSEPKMPSHLLSGSKVFPDMRKFGRKYIKREKETLLMKGESIYTTVAFIGRSTSRNNKTIWK